jgi:hypothetical protein
MEKSIGEKAIGKTPMVQLRIVMRLILPAILVLLMSTFAVAQTTRPSMPSAALELRATQSFNAGKYTEALPMLQQLASDLKSDTNQADRIAMLQEQIRVCEKNLAKPQVNATVQPVAVVKATDAARTPHPAPKAGETLDIAIKELGNFDYDTQTGSVIPDDVKALNGTTVRLTGFMVPMDQAESISKFALVPSLFVCCIGGPPQIQHTVIINCPKGKTVSYYPDELTVEGKLTVAEVKDDGYIVSIFAVEPTSVKPTAK